MIGSIFSDALGLAGIPTPATLNTTLDEILSGLIASRMIRARECLIEEISQGEVSLPDAADRDNFVAMLFRYDRAAREGAAAANLRLLARTIARHCHGRPIYADQFLRYAQIVEALSFEEILILGSIQRNLQHFRDHGTTEISIFVRDELTPSTMSVDELKSSISSLARTGIIFKGAVWGDDGTLFFVSDRFSEIARLAESFNVNTC